MRRNLPFAAAAVGAMIFLSSTAYADTIVRSATDSSNAAKSLTGVYVDPDSFAVSTSFTLSTAQTFKDVLSGAANTKAAPSIGASSWSVVATILQAGSGGSWSAISSSKLTLVFNPANYLSGGSVTGTTVNNSISLGAGAYKIKYDFAAAPSFVQSTTVTSTLTAVPGPIAGAGLPALLGLLGFTGYRRAKKNV